MKTPQKIYLVKNPGHSVNPIWYCDPSNHVTDGSIISGYVLNQENTVKAVRTVLDYEEEKV